ncbi:hypothetical protein PAHAL_2G095400 [Panicum hallii]|uniref:Uncharacterized protein n=1 Tax=Panicum hallii TaxID=206008 RepID=A0A2S3GX04_9POAL|nr:hypothetical protein PAHAL_2G095400 [Panicum hallii]
MEALICLQDWMPALVHSLSSSQFCIIWNRKIFFGFDFNPTLIGSSKFCMEGIENFVELPDSQRMTCLSILCSLSRHH